MTEQREPDLSSPSLRADNEPTRRGPLDPAFGLPATNALTHGGTQPPESEDPAYLQAPGVVETITVASITMLLTGVFVSLFTGYWERAESFGDGWAYREITNSILAWDFTGLTVKYTWGYPYLGAALAFLSPLSVLKSLVVVAWLSSLAAIGLAHRLWGGWVATYFAVTSIDWVQHSVFGGSDPLAIALTFGAFLAARRSQWARAALCASMAAIVRPQAVLALIAIGLVLLAQRDFRRLATCVVVGIAVLSLYLIPIWLAFGDPFANYHMYQSADFPTSLLTFPLGAIVEAFLGPYPWTQRIIVSFWILVVIAGVAVMARSPRSRAHAYRFPVEAVYVALSVAFCLTYNSPFGFHSFARYTLSILPVMYFALLPWLPRHRALTWSLALTMPAVAGASAMNVRRTIATLRRALGG